MKKLVQVLAIGALLLLLLPGMVWASSGKQPKAREKVSEVCASPIWAKKVLSFDQGERLNHTPVLQKRSNPRKALRQPDDKFVSLGFDGSITVAFKHPIANDDGQLVLYILVKETTWFNASEDYPTETARVFLIIDDKAVDVGTVNSRAEYDGTRGLARIKIEIPDRYDHVDAVKLEDETLEDDFKEGVEEGWEGWYNADAFDVDAVGTCSALASE
jgi:hypothetical protein